MYTWTGVLRQERDRGRQPGESEEREREQKRGEGGENHLGECEPGLKCLDGLPGLRQLLCTPPPP